MIVAKTHNVFYGNSCKKRYEMFTVVRRPDAGSPPGPDEVSVNVTYRGVSVAKAQALFSRAGQEAQYNPGPAIYTNAAQFGAHYVAGQLLKQKAGSAAYSPPTASVLTLMQIEVAPGFRRDGIATAIMDYLIHALKPEHMAAVVLPCYTPRVNEYVTNPAATDAAQVAKWLRAYGLEACGNVMVPTGGAAPVSVGAFGKKF